MLKMKVKGDKVYIYIKDEITGIGWTTEVDKIKFEQCVQLKKKAGHKKPKKSVMLDYALFDNCAIPLDVLIQDFI